MEIWPCNTFMHACPFAVCLSIVLCMHLIMLSCVPLIKASLCHAQPELPQIAVVTLSGSTLSRCGSVLRHCCETWRRGALALLGLKMLSCMDRQQAREVTPYEVTCCLPLFRGSPLCVLSFTLRIFLGNIILCEYNLCAFYVWRAQVGHRLWQSSVKELTSSPAIVLAFLGLDALERRGGVEEDFCISNKRHKYMLCSSHMHARVDATAWPPPILPFPTQQRWHFGVYVLQGYFFPFISFFFSIYFSVPLSSSLSLSSYFSSLKID